MKDSCLHMAVNPNCIAPLHPFDKLTVLLLRQNVGETLVDSVSSRWATEYSAQIGIRRPSRGGSPGPAPPCAALPPARAPQTNPATRSATLVPPPGALPAASLGPVLFLQPLSPWSLHTLAGHLYKTHSKSSPVIGTSCVRSGVWRVCLNAAVASHLSLGARKCPRC